jgi:hypothetical protein
MAPFQTLQGIFSLFPEVAVRNMFGGSQQHVRMRTVPFVVPSIVYCHPVPYIACMTGKLSSFRPHESVCAAYVPCASAFTEKRLVILLI